MALAEPRLADVLRALANVTGDEAEHQHCVLRCAGTCAVPRWAHDMAQCLDVCTRRCLDENPAITYDAIMPTSMALSIGVVVGVLLVACGLRSGVLRRQTKCA